MEKHIATVMKIPPNKRPGFSNGWLHGFKKRHGVSLRKKHGDAVSVRPEDVRLGGERMLRFTSMHDPRDIYNMDEISFYYRKEARRTLSHEKSVSSHKQDKTRLTLCVATNVNGSDNPPLLFIGTAANPHAFRGHNVANEIVDDYASRGKASMNSKIFMSWVEKLDKRMSGENHHILLLVDNVSSHVRPLKLLADVRLEFSPKNTTSFLQPLDQGIICNIKHKFYDIKTKNCFFRYMRGEPQEIVSIFTAVVWAEQAWDAALQRPLQIAGFIQALFPVGSECKYQIFLIL